MNISPYKIVYGKSCHLLVEVDHKASWVVKQLNFDFKVLDYLKKKINLA
jgi:hypothetical protein